MTCYGTLEIEIPGLREKKPDGSVYRNGKPLLLLEVEVTHRVSDHKYEIYHQAGVEEIWLYNQAKELILLKRTENDSAGLWRPMEKSEKYLCWD